MKVKTIAGNCVEIDLDEAMRIHEVVAGNPAAPDHGHHGKHSFNFHGRSVELTVPEMKEIADTWWEHYGKSAMEKFFTEYQQKAAGNIQKAVHSTALPASEPDVKNAISYALKNLSADVAAEVIFEAMEWETAYSGLKSIEL
jgi:hypothetical protein